MTPKAKETAFSVNRLQPQYLSKHVANGSLSSSAVIPCFSIKARLQFGSYWFLLYDSLAQGLAVDLATVCQWELIENCDGAWNHVCWKLRMQVLCELTYALLILLTLDGIVCE
jgi:hypothetical protein